MKGSGAHCWLRRLSRYRSCSCFHPRMGCDIDLYFCFASLRAAYSSMESLVSFACAPVSYTHLACKARSRAGRENGVAPVGSTKR